MASKNFAKTGTQTFTVVETKTARNKFMIEGSAKINLWGGGCGTVEMDTARFVTEDGLTLSDIADNLNDGRFGCESIAYGDVYVYQQWAITREKTNSKTNLVTTEEDVEWVSVYSGRVKPTPLQGQRGITTTKKAS